MAEVSTVWLLPSILGLALVLTYIFVTWLFRRTGVWIVAAMTVVGVVTIRALSIVDESTWAHLDDWIAAFVGFAGFFLGTEFRLERVKTLTRRVLTIGTLVSVFTLVLLVGLPLALLWEFVGETALVFALPLTLLSAMVLDTDRRHLTTLLERFEVEQEKLALVGTLGWLLTAIGFLAFFAALAAYQSVGLADPLLDPLAWAAIHLVLGAVVGIGGGLLLRPDVGEGHVVAVIVTFVLLVSGLALYFGLSAFMAAFVVGATLVHYADDRVSFFQVVTWGERPLLFALFLLVSIEVALEIDWRIYVFLLALLPLAYVARWLGGHTYRPRLRGLRSDPEMHRALGCPGLLSAAIVLEYPRLAPDSAWVDELAAGLVLAFLALSVWGSFSLRAWFIDVATNRPRTIAEADEDEWA